VSPRPSPAPAPDADAVARQVAVVRRRIGATGRDPSTVRLVAVTKGFDVTAVTAALAAGVTDIGENYAAELVAKAALLVGATDPVDGDVPSPPPVPSSPAVLSSPAVPSGPAVLSSPAVPSGPVPLWHYLGAVQRRQVPRLAPVVGYWHTLAREVEGRAIADRAPGATVLVEVDVSGLPGRNGCAPADVPDLVRDLRSLDLDVRGLMVVAPPGPAEVARAAFRTTARLGAELGLSELSMGMSDDLEVAVEEGSTMVRVGRALFGPRPGVAPAHQARPER
jgi:uncharacterized pyridoxal phosphate-containing UPF0001 family protein